MDPPLPCGHPATSHNCLQCHMCKHGRLAEKCQTCRETARRRCEHGKQRHMCKTCWELGTGGQYYCKHGKQKQSCMECKRLAGELGPPLPIATGKRHIHRPRAYDDFATDLPTGRTGLTRKEIEEEWEKNPDELTKLLIISEGTKKHNPGCTEEQLTQYVMNTIGIFGTKGARLSPSREEMSATAFEMFGGLLGSSEKRVGFFFRTAFRQRDIVPNIKEIMDKMTVSVDILGTLWLAIDKNMLHREAESRPIKKAKL